MADAPTRRRRVSPNLVAAVVLAVFAAGVLLWQQPWSGPERTTRAVVSADAAGTISRQIAALEAATDQQEFVTAAGNNDSARAWATRSYANLSKLAATDLGLRFVSGGEPDLRSDGATEATVDVRWRPGIPSGSDHAITDEAVVRFILDPVGDGTFAVRDVVRDNGVLPLWLAGALDVHTVDGATLITIDDDRDSQALSRYAERAHQAVARLWHDARTPLVVVAPHTQAQAADLLDEPPAHLDQIAAVTTTLDGSTRRHSAAVIILNPVVFAGMDARAAQIVMSHEATHLMTGATGSDLDSWVSEGFADYIALHDDHAPLRVSAGQILSRVRADGAPRELPTAADFAATAHGLGAVYESAWMAFRMLGARYGDRAVVEFYDDALSGISTAKAAQSAFGLTLAELTRQWRAYLTKSASTTS